jgi:mannan endo-1,4-beta-mannosidase
MSFSLFSNAFLPTPRILRALVWIAFAVVLGFSCTPEEGLPKQTDLEIPPVPKGPIRPFHVEGGSLHYQGLPVTYKGVNAMQTFGLVDPGLMNDWKVEIVREFIGNLREQPIQGAALQASDGKWYHSLQKIVDQNRAHKRITIFCPFGWVDEAGKQTLFTGLNPSTQSFYPAYRGKMQAIAEQFKNQPDVWLEVWNEPYSWNNQQGYTHALWLKDMADMVDNLRRVLGFQNIILVPGNEQGQSEAAVIANGAELLTGRYNLLFDLHAYEKWLQNTSEAQLVTRLQALKKANFAVVIGEVGVYNAGNNLDPSAFLAAVKQTDVSVMAWLWNQDSSYKNALLTNEGLPNATAENAYWGKRFQDYLKQ